MRTKHYVNGEGKRVKKSQPVVHNLIFVQLDRSREEMRELLRACPYPLSVYSKHDHPEQWCDIPDNDMFDLRMMCDNNFCEPVFISTPDCELKKGLQVRVVHGPLKGICGKLIRKSKKYYIVKSFDGFGAMVSVSRWCCEPDDGSASKGK